MRNRSFQQETPPEPVQFGCDENLSLVLKEENDTRRNERDYVVVAHCMPFDHMSL